jgi:hypothetical protein
MPGCARISPVTTKKNATSRRKYMYNELSNVGVGQDAEGHYTVDTPGVTAYRQLEDWMIGATMSSCVKDAGGNWVCLLSRPGGYRGYVIWNKDETQSFEVPTKWHVVRKRSLYVKTDSIENTNAVEIGPSPVILENMAPNLESLQTRTSLNQ